MKKRIIILCTALVIFSLAVVGFTRANTNKIGTEGATALQSKTITLDNKIIEGPRIKPLPDLYYGVDTRFAAIKKSDIKKATTIYDFLNEGEKKQIEHINSVKLVVIENNQQSNKQEYGSDKNLTSAQLKLLKSLDYFNHFTIRTEFRGKNMETGIIEDKFFGPHITVVPEQQATYLKGNEVLITYLKENSRDAMNVIKGEKLGAIKLSFIISKNGKISEVKHDAMTTGYPSIDEKFIELIKNIPGKWIPAENSKGEKIEQELVFTFGPADGC